MKMNYYLYDDLNYVVLTGPKSINDIYQEIKDKLQVNSKAKEDLLYKIWSTKKILRCYGNDNYICFKTIEKEFQKLN